MNPVSLFHLPPDSETLPNLLMVGLASDAHSVIEPAARSLGCFDRIVSFDIPPARLDELEPAYRDAGLLIDKEGYCLVVVVDLRRESLGSLSDVLNTLVKALAPVQVFCFVLEPPGGMTYRHFLASIASHLLVDAGGVTAAGDVEACVRHLRAWCVGRDGMTPLVRLTFPKTSSRWVRNITHDYLVRALNCMELPLRAAGMENAEREIEFWQNVIRNTIVFAHDHKPGRSRPAASFEQETASFRQVNSVPARLVVPRSLAAPLANAGLREGEDFVQYEAAFCADVVQREAREAALVLLHEPDMPVPALPADSIAPHLPRVLLVCPEYALPWATWNRLLASNVLGAYTEKELLTRIAESGVVARVKRGTWSAFAFRPLPRALAQIRELMTETLSRIEPHLKASLTEAVRLKFAQCVFQVRSAEGVYFGWPQAAEG